LLRVRWGGAALSLICMSSEFPISPEALAFLAWCTARIGSCAWQAGRPDAARGDFIAILHRLVAFLSAFTGAWCRLRRLGWCLFLSRVRSPAPAYRRLCRRRSRCLGLAFGGLNSPMRFPFASACRIQPLAGRRAAGAIVQGALMCSEALKRRRAADHANMQALIAARDEAMAPAKRSHSF